MPSGTPIQKISAVSLEFLGTGTSQGVPMIACDCPICQSENPKDKRLRSAALIHFENFTIAIDSGPDFRQQMLRSGVRHLDAIFLTHEHKDHIAGLDDVRAFNFFSGNPMKVYASEAVQKALFREFPYVFSGPAYPGIPRIDLLPLENQSFDFEGFEIIPIEVMHLKLPVLGFRFGDLVYITDANAISEVEKDKLKGSKVLVINALRKQKHVSHFNLEEALALIEEIKPERAYLTHLSHQMGLHEEIEKELPQGVYLAYDGLKIAIS